MRELPGLHCFLSSFPARKCLQMTVPCSPGCRKRQVPVLRSPDCRQMNNHHPHRLQAAMPESHPPAGPCQRPSPLHPVFLPGFPVLLSALHHQTPLAVSPEYRQTGHPPRRSPAAPCLCPAPGPPAHLPVFPFPLSVLSHRMLPAIFPDC